MGSVLYSVQQRKNLVDAPETIAQGDSLPGVHYFANDIGYKPMLGAVPTFNLPTQLNLPNVAQISVSFDLKSIAPSLPTIALPGTILFTWPVTHGP